MTISFDLDGTFYAEPQIFSALGQALQKDGHTVGILTGHHVSAELSDRQQLLEIGSFVPNFYYGRDDQALAVDVFQWKAGKLDSEGIDIHIDDDAGGIAKYTRRFMLKTKGWLPTLF